MLLIKSSESKTCAGLYKLVVEKIWNTNLFNNIGFFSNFIDAFKHKFP